MLMNNDALVERDTIARMVEAAADGRSLVTPTELDWQGRTWFLSRGGAYPLAIPLYLVLRTLKKRFDTGEPFAISIACALMAKKKFLEIPPNEHISFYEELEWCWRLRLCGVNLKVLDNARFLHKGAATAGQTAKAAYYSGRNNLAAHFECLRLYSLLLFIPPLTLYYLLKPVVYLSRRRPGYAKAFLSGMVSFFRDVRVFWHDRNIVQEKRQISDFCIVRDMINSCAFIQRSSHLTTREYISKILHSP
jgi:GT2 family glycosyltransferase